MPPPLRHKLRHFLLSTLFVALSLCAAHCGRGSAPLIAVEPDKDGEELFRKIILPMFEEHCFECHSAKAEELKGGLRLDTREGLAKGGDTGPAVKPGDVEDSLLLRAMRYKEDDLKMPPKGKLPDKVLEEFERWVKLGAPDPRADEKGKRNTDRR